MKPPFKKRWLLNCDINKIKCLFDKIRDRKEVVNCGEEANQW